MSTDHRALAVATHNRCWDLLDAGVVDAVVADELCATAFASKYHWGIAGGPREAAIADWMVSRAAAAAAHVDPAFGPLALRYALAAEAAPVDGAEDWLVASMAEGVARAALAACDRDLAARWLATAEERIAAIADAEERATIRGQFDELAGASE